MDFWRHLLLDRLVSSKHKKQAMMPCKSHTCHLVKPDFRASGKTSRSSFCVVDHSQMDPLLARGYHNLRCSRLGRLPEELLLNVMCRLGPLDKMRLRHVSRLFMRLYESRELSVGFGAFLVAGLPWRTPPFYVHTDLEMLTRLLANDLGDYCDACRHTRRHFRWPWHFDHLTRNRLFCGRCRLHHPRHLFSERERRNRDSAGRVCIAHQGAVRLCSHASVRLADVLPIVRSELQRSRLAGQPLVSKTRLLMCSHPSHQPDHQGHALPLYEPKKAAPTLYVIVDMPRAMVHLLLEWHGHLVLPGQRPVTAEMVNDGIAKLRVGAAEFIFPELPGGRLPEMTCVDPQIAAFLSASTGQRAHAGWLGRLGSTNRLWTQRKNRPADEKETEDTTHSLRMCWTSNSLVDGVSKAAVHLNRCKSGHPSCVEVECSSRIEVFPLSDKGRGPGVMEPMIEFPLPTWIQALDPDSYGITGDRLGFGVAWCPNRECKNYYRCLKRPFICLKDMYWNGGHGLFSTAKRIYR
ncbi:f-box domain containing protein [Grosmannia clavigera kw1407]|uniref:F-box domain containing protein n=1 Tax=Grosmannia clavigera (strain kw1407 / UAMH 11150) TaxID=655863 RepID=F0XUB4_GROCL|nr:f-box domain containing protein [Grosmannia clavigera kw1407]EFW98767.1 f-box domain containing protein [Grosmannia clavigera kw1407]